MRLSDNVFAFLRPINFRGKYRLLNHLVPKTGLRRTKVFGADLELDLATHIDRHIFIGSYELPNVHRFRHILKEGMTVLDVGANIGYFSFLSAQLVGKSGTVISIEPHPSNFHILKSIVEAEQLSQVTPIQVGLSNSPGMGIVSMTDLLTFPNRTASMAIKRPAGSDDNNSNFEVRTTTLDSIITEYGIKSVDLLKIDVDGLEWQILEGSKDSLAKNLIKNIIIECNAFWLKSSGKTEEDVIKMLNSFGFDLVPDKFLQFTLGKLDDRLFRLSYLCSSEPL